jgi:ribosomal protein S18 acetylase RimI-like enzyme
MPAIEIRPAIETDIPILTAIDHSYASSYVWQMELESRAEEVSVNFRQVRLPRTVRVEYPHSPKLLGGYWKKASEVLVALLDGEPVGYLCLQQDLTPLATWVTDLAVHPRLRRKGIGSTLVLAAQEWTASQPRGRRLTFEFQPKNHPAISLAYKLGYDFCGYNDQHFANQDLAVFFAKWV